MRKESLTPTQCLKKSCLLLRQARTSVITYICSDITSACRLISSLLVFSNFLILLCIEHILFCFLMTLFISLV